MWVEDVDPAVFDEQFFNISRADCIAMEPQQRQLLEVSYECLENGGIPLDKISGIKTEVIIGTNFIGKSNIRTFEHNLSTDCPLPPFLCLPI